MIVALFTWEFGSYKKWTNLDIQRIKLPLMENQVVSVYVDIDQHKIVVKCIKFDDGI